MPEARFLTDCENEAVLAEAELRLAPYTVEFVTRLAVAPVQTGAVQAAALGVHRDACR